MTGTPSLSGTPLVSGTPSHLWNPTPNWNPFTVWNLIPYLISHNEYPTPTIFHPVPLPLYGPCWPIWSLTSPYPLIWPPAAHHLELLPHHPPATPPPPVTTIWPSYTCHPLPPFYLALLPPTALPSLASSHPSCLHHPLPYGSPAPPL